MQLDQLPDEILLEIIDQLARAPSLEFPPSWPDSQYSVTRKLDLIRFSEASRKLYNLARSKVFEAIIIKAPASYHVTTTNHLLGVEELCLQPFPSTFRQKGGPLQFVKSIKVAIESSQGFNDCCLHRDFRDTFDSSSDYTSDSDDDNLLANKPAQPDDIEAYGLQILNLLKFSEPGTLRSFYWDLGACVPDVLFGKSGYLPMHQNQIENLFLTTDGSCMRSANKSLPGLNVQNFRSLKSVSWKGIQNYSELNALRLLLDNNASHLNCLELGLLDCQYYQSFLEVEISGAMPDLLPKTILGLSLPDMRLHFPSLQYLSLSGMQLRCDDTEIQDMITALNIRGLRKLRLLRCSTSVVPFLQAILETKTAINLQSIELEIFDEVVDDELLSQNIISNFLTSFNGLQELHLLTDMFHRPSDIWAAIECHRRTLKQLVWHDRRDSYAQICDVEQSALHDMFNDVSQFPGQFPLLESVGLGTNCHLKELFEMSNLSFLDSVKLLHLRGTRKDLEGDGFILYNFLGINRNHSLEMLSEVAMDFARWAFGPRGFPKLRVLACGDPYSRDIREGNWMLSRNTPSAGEPELFRWTNLTTCEELTGITNSFQVLSACPMDLQMP